MKSLLLSSSFLLSSLNCSAHLVLSSSLIRLRRDESAPNDSPSDTTFVGSRVWAASFLSEEIRQGDANNAPSVCPPGIGFDSSDLSSIQNDYCLAALIRAESEDFDYYDTVPSNLEMNFSQEDDLQSFVPETPFEASDLNGEEKKCNFESFVPETPLEVLDLLPRQGKKAFVAGPTFDSASLTELSRAALGAERRLGDEAATAALHARLARPNDKDVIHQFLCIWIPA